MLVPDPVLGSSERKVELGSVCHHPSTTNRTDVETNQQGGSHCLPTCHSKSVFKPVWLPPPGYTASLQFRLRLRRCSVPPSQLLIVMKLSRPLTLGFRQPWNASNSVSGPLTRLFRSFPVCCRLLRGAAGGCPGPVFPSQADVFSPVSRHSGQMIDLRRIVCVMVSYSYLQISASISQHQDDDHFVHTQPFRNFDGQSGR